MTRAAKPEPKPTTDFVHVAYGSAKPVIIAAGPRAQMEAYAKRMNAQAPGYNHRILEDDDV